MGITHKPKAGATLTGTEYEAADAHIVSLVDADIPATIARDTEVTAAVNDHTAAADPHSGYRLESADHSHATTGLQGGTVAHGALTGLTTGDPHTQYVLAASVNYVDLTDGGQTALHSHAGGSGAPTDVDYLVGTASAGLSAEIVVGTSPGGELGGTWASPTVDATHAGGTHLTLGTTPSTQAFADVAAGGAATDAAKTDHKHAMPANPVTAHEAAGDPHTGYRLESADHTHASAGLQGGQIAYSALTGYPSLTTASAFATAETTVSAATYADITGCSVSLAAGTWLVFGHVVARQPNAIIQVFVAITHSDNTVIAESAMSRPASGTANLNSPVSVSWFAIVSPGSTTTYKLRGARGVTTHTGSWVAMDGNGVNTANHATNNTDKGTGIFAVRIA